MEMSFLTTEGQIAYRQYPGRGTPIVLIHGLGADSSSWKHVIDHYVSQGRTIVVMDLRGHGKSQGSKDFMYFRLSKMAGDLREILLHIGCTDAIIIGHCLGGAIAQLYHAQYRDARGYILMSTTAYNKRKNMERLLRAYIRFSPFKMFYRTSRHTREHRAYEPYRGSRDLAIKKNLHALIKTFPHTYFCALAHFSTFDATRYLETYTVPVRVVVGENDSIFPPSVSRDLASHIPTATLHIMPSVNHIIPLNAPDELNTLLDELLAGMDQEHKHDE